MEEVIVIGKHGRGSVAADLLDNFLELTTGPSGLRTAPSSGTGQIAKKNATAANDDLGTPAANDPGPMEVVEVFAQSTASMAARLNAFLSLWTYSSPADAPGVDQTLSQIEQYFMTLDPETMQPTTEQQQYQEETNQTIKKVQEVLEQEMPEPYKPPQMEETIVTAERIQGGFVLQPGPDFLPDNAPLWDPPVRIPLPADPPTPEVPQPDPAKVEESIPALAPMPEPNAPPPPDQEAPEEPEEKVEFGPNSIVMRQTKNGLEVTINNAPKPQQQLKTRRAEENKLRKDKKNRKHRTMYRAMLKVINETWGRVTELMDIAEALGNNMTLYGDHEVLLQSGKTLHFTGKTELKNFSAQAQQAVLKEISAGNIPLDAVELDQMQFAVDLAYMQAEDMVIGRMSKAAGDALADMGHISGLPTAPLPQ